MSALRLKKLLEFLEEAPNDPFTIYAVATEYRRSDPKKTLHYFERLLQEHPNYVATYYHAAQLYLDIGKTDRAEEVFTKGIAIAREHNDALALRELQNAYNEFLFEE